MKKLLLLVAAATLMLGATAATPKIASQAKQASVLKLNQEAKTNVNKEYTSTGMLKVQANAGAMRAKAAVTPEGETKPYAMSAYLNSLFGMSYYAGVAVNISTSEDASKIFFDNMFPMQFANGETWVQGNVSTDGNSVVIPADVSVAELDWTDSSGELHTDICYVGELVLSGPDEEGYYTIEGIKEAVYTKDGDKI